MSLQSVTQVAGLAYAVDYDNSAGGNFQYDLLVLDLNDFTVTFPDGSTNELTQYFSEQVLLLANSLNIAGGGVFSSTKFGQALISLQSLSPTMPTPPVQRVFAPAGKCTYFVTLPAGVQECWFLWGMTHSIDGGFALPGGSAGAGGSGDVTQVTATSPLASSGGNTPAISISTAGAASDDVIFYNGMAWTRGPVPNTGSATKVPVAATPIVVDDGTLLLQPGAAVIMTALPTLDTAGIAAGTKVTLVGNDGFSTEFQGEGALPGSKLRLGAASRVVAQYDTLTLVYDGAEWCEISFSNNS